MGRRSVLQRGLVAVCTLVVASGCLLVAAGAGAGGGVYYTSRGAESVVPASAGATFAATQRAFKHFKIERRSLTVEDEGRKRELEGRSEDREADVTVKLEREDSNTTRVEVTARTSLVTWDKDFAREIVEKIIEFAR